ncbi:MAG: GTP-binding protein [Candidatus Aenigmatarchaeota archaeon]
MIEKTKIPRKENKNIEFKEKLSIGYHLREGRKEQLASQMKFRLEVGNGRAIYVIGVSDDGVTKGLTEIEFEETLSVLRAIAAENDAEILKVEKFSENGKTIGRVLISKRYGAEVKSHIIVATAGHVGSGKSTLIATLIRGKRDVNGKAWLYLNILPHEIERGLSADLHFTLYGFKDGKPINLENPLDKKERAVLIESADKVVSFVDTVGHETFLHTAIRGLIGQYIDYGILVVSADDGVTYMTKEHMGLLLAMNLPIITCITKTDKVGNKRLEEVENNIEGLFKLVGKVPFKIRDERDVTIISDKLDTSVPIIRTSAVTLEGYNLLNKLLLILPGRRKEIEKPFLMFIDRIYNIPGTGTVVSGTIRQGKLKTGSKLLIGPNELGEFKQVRAKSIEMHYYPLKEANAGFIVGIAIKGVKNEDVERGMILCDEELNPKAVKSFEAEVLVLNHPTRISSGYEPVVCIETIQESAKFELLDKKYLKAGESGNVRITFKYKPRFIQLNDSFVFREGRTKGIGTITKIVKYA